MREEAGSEPLDDTLATDEQLVIDVGAHVQVLAMLERVGMSDPQVRADWLRNPHPTFGRVAPIDVIARDAHYDVVALIETFS